MLRKALILASLFTITACLAATAQSPNADSVTGRASRVRGSKFRRPPAAPLAAAAGTESASLTDRLKAIRGQVVSGGSEPSAGEALSDNTSLSPEMGPSAPQALRSVLVNKPPRTAPVVEPDRSAAAPLPRQTNEPRQLVETPAEQVGPNYRIASHPIRPSDRKSDARSPAAFHAGSNSKGSQLSITGQTPAIQVETEGPRAIAVGKEANYRIRMVNRGEADAERVLVNITVPDSVQIISTRARLGSVNARNTTAPERSLVWEVDRVAANSQHELVITLQPTENSPIDLRVEWVCRPTALAARIEVQQPQLAIAVSGATEMRYGETTVFQIRLSNPGNGPAENVVVALGATGAANQPNSIGTLAAGESRTMEVELTAKQAGVMQIHAKARGDGELQAESVHEVRVRRADLAVAVAAPRLLYADSMALYQIRVANRGDAAATDVVLQVDLPSGAKNGIGIDKAALTTNQPRWQLGDLAAGAEQVYTMQCDLTAAGENRLVAQIQDADKLTASDTATTTVEAIADLKLIVNDPKGPVPAGKDVQYEIRIVNQGSKEAQNIDLVAQFSEGIEPSATKGHRSQIVPGQVIFEPIRTLPAGGQITVQITARAQKSGNLRFRAELTCGDPETKLVSEENTRFYAAAEVGNSHLPPANRSTGAPTPARR